nr:hypothetical protein [Tanacetum cinerariifolium]
MVVIDDHVMIYTREGSFPRDVIETGEGSVPTDVLDVDVSDNQSYRNDPDFSPTPNGTPYWRPDLPEDEKPKLGDIFDTYDDGYNMYKVYSEKGKFNIRKSGIKRYKGKVTHGYVLCNRAGKVRSKFDINILKEADANDEEKDGNTKRKCKTVSRVTNCLEKIGLKVIHGTDCYKLFGFVKNHNHPLMNENNMDVSRARRQFHFSDYIYIHRASLSNIGPTLAHRLKVALMGGYDKVCGTPGDYRNFKRAMNLFIRDRDAQMIVDKMINWQFHVPKFSFEHYVLHDELVSMFWDDDTMKFNYAVFGDVVSFDATFRTNKYDFVFVPLTVHQKQPTLAIIDQDAALRNVVVIMFPDSKHRLCMWHITQKHLEKILGDLDTDSEFRKEFHKLIWNVFIRPEVFEKRWNSLITKYNLQDNKWLSDMYAIIDRWIHGYFKEYPMCGLMKTTSRSESSNAYFQIFSHKEKCNMKSTKVYMHVHRLVLILKAHFCVLCIHNIVRIPETYIHRRWTKEALPAHLLEKRHKYGPCIKEIDRLAAKVHATIKDCVGLLRSNTDKLTHFLTTFKEMKKQLEVKMQSSNYDNNKEALYADLFGVTIPEQVV